MDLCEVSAYDNFSLCYYIENIIYVNKNDVQLTVRLIDARYQPPMNKYRNELTRQYQYLFNMENVDLVFEDSALRAVAKRALERNTGARGLRSILENVLLETMYDLPSRTDVGTVFINEAVINGEAEPVYKPERQPKETATHESVAKADLKVIDSKSA